MGPGSWCFVHFDLQMCFAPQPRGILEHRNFQNGSAHVVFCAFWLANVLFATAACHFSPVRGRATSAPAALASLLFEHQVPRFIEKTQRFGTSLTFFAHVELLASDSTHMLIFLLVTWLMLIFLLLTWLLCDSAFQLYILSEVRLLNFLRQVVPGRAGGGSFKRKKNHIAEKDFAYRMCARWPTIAMSKIFFWVWTKLLPLHGGAVMWRSVMCLWFDFLSSSDVASCEVICGTTPVLLCTTKTYNVLLQYYSNVLLRTTTYYSRTTLYYKVLLQYYSVLRSTTPYCKVLRQYYSALHSTTPVLLCTTKYYSSSTPVLQSTTLYYKVLRQYYKVLRQYYYVLLQYYSVLQSVEQVKSPANLTKYCACHEILKLKISAETPWMLPPIERRFDDNPTISDHKIVISHPPLRRPDSSQLGDDFVL